MKSYLYIWIGLLAGAVGAVILSELVGSGIHGKMMNEGGWVETASWISYFVAAFFIFLKMLRSPNRWSMLAGTMLLGMRELDFDKRFTTMGIFKSRFYSSSDVPILEKLIALVITAVIIAALFVLVKNHLKPFIQKVKARSGASCTVLLAGGLLFFAKSIDGLSRKLEPFGIEPSDAVNRIAGSVEECFELTGALLVVVAAVGAYLHRSK
ncbi:hypothetical protein [Pontiella agarivorans]|uniref:Uncharacterized protein n=1 Tax=Pontiella agarivorans TaxID=3038953 RepID=A0ABU5MXR2_9BACT|nr:hypothetical protein [Pontiella agarivorans]MDZ8118983.1 hypothetical protein [Pontiella agarivorans]